MSVYGLAWTQVLLPKIPGEPERAGEARRADSASLLKCLKSKLLLREEQHRWSLVYCFRRVEGSRKLDVKTLHFSSSSYRGGHQTCIGRKWHLRNRTSP